MGSITGCTLVYADELPSAAVLANSFLRFHPEATFAVLVIDGLRGRSSLPNAQVLSLADLGLEPGGEWRLPMLFDDDELRAFFEPVLLERLLRINNAPVAYFSASTQVLASLADVLEKVTTADGIVATELIKNEFGDHGRSFVGVPSGGGGLLRSKDPARVIREAGFAVHYSNLDPTSLTRASGAYQIGGHPLLSFDFRGYDPKKPHLLSRYLGLEPRILLSEFPVLAELCDTYREKLLEAGPLAEQVSHQRFKFLPSGIRMDTRMSRIYREALVKFKAGHAPEPPSAFELNGEDRFLNWLNEPIDQERKGVTRYMLAVYEDRPDVKTAFPDPMGRDATAFRHWYLAFGAPELNIPPVFVPSEPAVSSTTSPAAPVNVAGYFRAELGIGTAARSLVTALEAADIPINTVPFEQTVNRLAHPFAERAVNDIRADTNIVCVNPDQIRAFAEQAGPEFWHGRYSIGVWFWEVEDFPAPLHYAFNHVDEIWVASDFTRQAFLKVSPKPVFRFRLPVLAPTIDKSLTRAQLNLPEQFIFLFSFDFLSVLERKNPLGLIKAFTTAFAPLEGPRLVIKTINGDKRTLEMEKLRYAIRSRPDVLLMDGYLGAIENATLTALSDCYVSLHRSEGFGLTIAEAMALGKPAIATAYSGNLEFMTPENSYLCPAERSQVGPEREPYPSESYWSEPDIGAAAKLLQRVYRHQDEARARGQRAAEDIRLSHAPAGTGKIVSERLAVIRRRRARKGPARSLEYLQDEIDQLQERLRQSGSNT